MPNASRPDTIHLAFSTQYPGLMRELVSKIGVRVPQNTPPIPNQLVIALAVWDTGANGSVITPALMAKLGLVPTGKTQVHGVNSTQVVDVCMIDIILPNNVYIGKREVTVCTLGPGQIEMLIGMDIILLGDFSIANHGSKTLFSFALPPFSNPTNLLDKANQINKRAK